MPSTPIPEKVRTAYQHFLSFRQAGDVPLAHGALYEALREAGPLERPRLHAVLLLQLGQFYLDAQGDLQNAAHAFAAGVKQLQDTDFRAELEQALAPIKEMEKEYLGSRSSLPDVYRPETEAELSRAEQDHLLLVKLMVNNGNCLLELGQDALALEVFKSALSLPSLEQDDWLTAQVLTNTAEAYRRLEQPTEAEPLLERAQDIFSHNEELDAKEFLAVYACLRRDQERWEEADRLFAEALAGYRNSEDHQGYSRTLTRLAQLHLSRKAFGKAKPWLEAARDLGEQSKDRSNLVFIYEGLARCYLGEGQYEAAIPYLDQCLVTLRALTEDVIQTEQGKVSRIAGMEWSLNALIDCLLKRMQSRQHPEQTGELILSKIDELHGLILDAVVEGVVSPFQKSAQVDLPAGLRWDTSSPVAQTGRADYITPPEEVVRHSRRENVPPLFRLVYHLANDGLIIVSSRPGENPVVFSQLLSRTEIRENVSRLIRSLKVDNAFRGQQRDVHWEDAAGRDYEALLKEWYQRLIQPVAGSLPPEGSILVIEPHDALHMVPFDILVSAQGAYLCDQYAVLVSPSQDTLNILRSYQPYHSDLASAKALIVGNPEMKGRIEVDGKTYSGLTSLPGAEKEARLIQELFPAENVTYLTGPAATEQAIEAAVSESNVIHLATHGIAYENKPMSSLLLTAGGAGYVTARDIRAWKMPADLVVLSACQTALGRLAATEGIIGLSRSFFLAGARTIVVSLWSVDDSATALLMEHFYRALFAGKNVPQALREAKLKLKCQLEYTHPHYWAGFVVMGAEE